MRCISMRRIMLLFLLSLSLCGVSSCEDKNNNQSSNNTLVSIDEIRSNIDIISLTIKNTQYSNLDFSDIRVDFPDISEYHNLRLKFKNDIGYDEHIETIKSMVKTFFPEHSYSENNLFWWGNLEDISQYPNGWVKYPMVSEKKNEIISDGINGTFLYESDSIEKHINDAYLTIRPYTFAATINKKTNIPSIDEQYEHLATLVPIYIYEPVERYYVDSLPDTSYKLYNKEVSVKDAVKHVADFFENDYKKAIPESKISPKVSAIDVCSYENFYGYRILLRNAFENIPFDYVYDLGSVSKMSDGKEYSRETNEAFMATSDDITFLYMDQPYAQVEYDSEAITRIISLEKAVEIMSTQLTDSVIFDVQSVEFVYCASYDEYFTLNSEATAKPAWKLTALNTNDNRDYIVYIDAHNGENFRYYTRSYE